MRSDAARRAELRARVVAEVRNRPGVYRMVGPGGEVLYVGKSKHLRARLLSYFRCPPGSKGHRILQETAALEWTPLPSEFAAVREEFTQIKRWRPRYNVEHKRDPHLCFLKLTAEPAPRLVVVGRVGDDRADYFGPFRGVTRVRAAARELVDALGLRDCPGPTPMRFADQTELFPVELAPRCHRFELRRCLAPCTGGCTQAAYWAQVEAARAFLRGHGEAPLAALRTRLERAAARWDFEYAAHLRDRLERLARLQREFALLREDLDRLRCLYLVPGVDGEDRLYLLDRGLVRGEWPAPCTPADWAPVRRAVAELQARAVERGLPTRRMDEILLVHRWFRTHPEEWRRTQPWDGAWARVA